MAKKTPIKKILILEDEEALANLYANKLKEAGFEVQIFSDTNDLLESCKAFHPDAAFLDHSLHAGEKSGLDVIPTLRKCNPDMKIVMLSNYSEFQMEAESKKAGADDYLLKINTSPAVLVKYVQDL